jgi:hypothetical protein
MTPTPTTVRKTRRRPDRRRAGAAQVLTAMSRGEKLHKHLSRLGAIYTLSNGTHVTADVATVVVADIRVVAGDDGLFPTTSQTWRWIERGERT